jgi:hypothetical protein
LDDEQTGNRGEVQNLSCRMSLQLPIGDYADMFSSSDQTKRGLEGCPSLRQRVWVLSFDQMDIFGLSNITD